MARVEFFGLCQKGRREEGKKEAKKEEGEEEMKSPMIGYGKCYRTSFHLLELLHHLVSSSLLLFFSSTASTVNIHSLSCLILYSNCFSLRCLSIHQPTLTQSTRNHVARTIQQPTRQIIFNYDGLIIQLMNSRWEDYAAVAITQSRLPKLLDSSHMDILLIIT